MKPFSVLVPLIALVLGGCAATRPVAVGPAATAPVPALAETAGPRPDDNLNAVVWTQTAIERELLARQAFAAAREQLSRALADPAWDALPHDEREGRVDRLAPAIIVDIDETMLDNSPYQARLVRDGASYDEFTWAQWCREQRAQAVPGALEFARDAAERGVTVFYLSNRARDLNTVTLANLRKLGFPIADRQDVFLGLGTVVPGCEQNGSEKGCRRRLVAREHRVLMQFGDQIGDFVDVLANTPAGRRQAVEPYLGWIGERWFVLPNPTYGSWEPALFNNAWSLPAAERRRMKLDALDYQDK
ncbi:MAG TPA: HAD family acid phosphatase [Dokdonella sp.]|uniref:5'-nucleotidase, lipoprotein e(P4) family n=1 Tax=Dokdonella sp. TaxID=2291710 RepID=UPI002C08B6B9|nr:HAD family acid phosphatase [Dokdonella sp.]HUD42881.1 HAD family acid phosphatase [Dokdonella sp.]